MDSESNSTHSSDQYDPSEDFNSFDDSFDLSHLFDSDGGATETSDTRRGSGGVTPRASGVDTTELGRVNPRTGYRWRQSLTEADRLLAAAEPRLRRYRARLSDPAARLRPPLAALVMAAQNLYGNTRPATVESLLVGYLGDVTQEDAAVADDGAVTPGTIAYMVLDTLLTAKDNGVPEPHDAIEAWSGDDDNHGTIDEALLTVLRSGRSTYNGGDNHEHSSLNFTVPTTGPTGRSLADIRADLDTRPGLHSIKAVIDQLAAQETIKTLRLRHGIATDTSNRHMVFTGNPGTGKTTVARIIAEVLDATGSLPGAHLVEADRSMLVGEWLGSSALKTRKVAEAAIGGVLFIDEAYSLTGAGDGNHGSGPDRFGMEALATLLKIMEDERDELVVILAGYPNQMRDLLRANPGLSSRIGQTIDFPDYTDDELLAIFTHLSRQAQYTLGPDADTPLRRAIPHARPVDGFGNARWVRNTLDAAIRAHALRLTTAWPDGNIDIEELQTLRLADTHAAIGQTTG